MFKLLVISIFLTNLPTSLYSASSFISSKYATSNSQKLQESFRDWDQWKARYPQCNPGNNPNLSPIVITSDNIDPTSHLKAIFVNSKIPVDDCLTLSILYKDGDFEMEAGNKLTLYHVLVTLNALPACENQLTQISDAGELVSNIRYFKRAIFFFTNTAVEEECSLHQINGKKFQMEIMMEFVAKNGNDYTQIFSLVEARPSSSTPANPIFSVLESALSDLKKEIVDEAAGNTPRALKFKELQTICHNNEQQFIESHDETKDIFASERLNKIEKLLQHIEGITNKALIELAENNKMLEKDAKMDDREDKLEKLREQRSTLLDMMKGENDANALDDLQEFYEKVQVAIKLLEGQMGLGASKSEHTLESMKQLLRANKVGVPGESAFPGMLYDSPDAVHEELFNIKQNISDYVNKKRLYDESCEEFFKFKKAPYGFVRINVPFQISWLFPQSEGYYIYQGSNPIPKCEERDITIVFEKPLIISTEQLSIFQNLPSLNALQGEGAEISNPNNTIEDSSKVDKMIPVLADRKGNRMVWYVPKKPVFLGEDGFHMRSSLSTETSESSGNVMGNRWIYTSIFSYCTVGISLLVKL